ncbi:MAG TPA: DUF2059 domain-containing protein [Candidatus Obscuribacterales bacterium]
MLPAHPKFKTVALAYTMAALLSQANLATAAEQKEKEATKTPAAEEKAPSSARTERKVSPEKLAAIKELLSVTEISKVSDEMYDMLLKQGQRSFTENLVRSIQNDDRKSEEQKKDLLQKAVASSDRMFARYRELLPKEINLGQVLENVALTVYDKYFTVDELKGITAFYRTPAGRKALQVLPQVMQESAAMTGEIITPKVQTIVRQVVQEEHERIVKAAAEEAAQAAASGEKKPDKTSAAGKTTEAASASSGKDAKSETK